MKKQRLIKGRLPKIRQYGRIEFWSDVHHFKMAIVVECDCPNYPVIAVFRYKNGAEKASAEIRADRLLVRVRSGKVDYRMRSQSVPQEFRWDRTYAGNRG